MELSYYDNLTWYRIPGYNGYEYNFENKIVRSLKNYKQNPIGKLIKKQTDKKGEYYEMSNMQNKRVKVYLSEIESLIKKDDRKVKVGTYSTNLEPRNKVTRNKFLHCDQEDPENKTFFPSFDSMIIDNK